MSVLMNIQRVSFTMSGLESAVDATVLMRLRSRSTSSSSTVITKMSQSLSMANVKISNLSLQFTMMPSKKSNSVPGLRSATWMNLYRPSMTLQNTKNMEMAISVPQVESPAEI